MLNVITLPLGVYQTNCYLISRKDSDSCVVIDPGDTPEAVLEQAAALGKTVSAILLTHCHFDHVGAVKSISEATGCPVYLHPEELSLPERLTGGPLFHTDTYAEGDTLTLAGLRIQVLHTPGHTPGCVCLAIEDCLFTGDTLFMGTCGRTDLPGGDWDTIASSLKRLKGLDVNYKVYPGHGTATTLDRERNNNPYMP